MTTILLAAVFTVLFVTVAASAVASVASVTRA
jgi:hypothetical protein